jgi:hypothetical protein
LQEDEGRWRGRKHAGNPKMDERNGYKHTQEQKTYAGPTSRERRE